MANDLLNMIKKKFSQIYLLIDLIFGVFSENFVQFIPENASLETPILGFNSIGPKTTILLQNYIIPNDGYLIGWEYIKNDSSSCNLGN